MLEIRRCSHANDILEGELAKLSGVGVETIRFYERAGVLPKPKRKPSGYRQFDMETVERIRYIESIQELGFSLAEADLMGEAMTGRTQTVSALRGA